MITGEFNCLFEYLNRMPLSAGNEREVCVLCGNCRQCHQHVWSTWTERRYGKCQILVNVLTTEKTQPLC